MNVFNLSMEKLDMKEEQKRLLICTERFIINYPKTSEGWMYNNIVEIVLGHEVIEIIDGLTSSKPSYYDMKRRKPVAYREGFRNYFENGNDSIEIINVKMKQLYELTNYIFTDLITIIGENSEIDRLKQENVLMKQHIENQPDSELFKEYMKEAIKRGFKP